MREKLARFFAGRNGPDALAKTYAFGAVICFLLAGIVGRSSESAISILLWFAGLALMVVSYFRLMSRNLAKRRVENERFLEKTRGLRGAFTAWKDRRAQSKDYKFFKCPSCGTMLRVPRGKGRIRVICRKCGNSFEKKT